MKLTYDPRHHVAYIRLRERSGQVETICVSDELNIDMAPDGTIYGIELLDATPFVCNQQAAYTQTAWFDVRATVAELLRDEEPLLPAGRFALLLEELTHEIAGLGPLEPLLADPAVDEVMVSGAGRVWVERAGRVEETAVAFASETELRHAIERILAPLGRRVDEAEPICDARLPDGSRVYVVIPPLALDGPALTIRRFRRRGLSPAELRAVPTGDPDETA